jgi:glycosyltransferase involved in cell wall biosynthesis
MVVANTFAIDNRVRREAKSLAGQGFKVHVLCWDRKGKRPQVESMDGCQVRNVRFGQTTMLVSSRLHYLIVAVLFQAIIFMWALRLLHRTRALIMHAHDFNTLLACALVRRVFKGRLRLIYDSHEFTAGIYQEWYGSLISKSVGNLERIALSQVDAIIGANEAIRRHLAHQTSIPSQAIYLCPAVAEIPEINSFDAKQKLGLRGCFVVLFSGLARQDYNFNTMLVAARELRRRGLSDVRFLFIGPIETMESLIKTVNSEDLQGFFDFRGWVPDQDLLLHYLASDLCYAVTSNLGPNTSILTPTKMFESMACGVPVVVRDRTLAAEMVRSWRCGLVIGSRTTFLAQLLRVRKNPEELHTLGAGGVNAFHQVYNWDAMETKLFWLYNEIEKRAIEEDRVLGTRRGSGWNKFKPSIG